MREGSTSDMIYFPQVSSEVHLASAVFKTIRIFISRLVDKQLASFVILEIDHQNVSFFLNVLADIFIWVRGVAVAHHNSFFF